MKKLWQALRRWVPSTPRLRSASCEDKASQAPSPSLPAGLRHVAIVMDGNGRWAVARHRPRFAGHHEGAKAARRIVQEAARQGLPYLTLFAFSSENWQRPEAEVAELLELLKRFLVDEVAELMQHNIKLRVIGQTEKFPENLRALIASAEQQTANNSGLCLVMAMSYSGRDDIVQAVESLLRQSLASKLPGTVTPAMLEAALSTHGIPAPDLLIRTSGEKRVSNFLLWQIAYTELYFTDVLWPDFREEDFRAALANFAQRNRRYGRTSHL